MNARVAHRLRKAVYGDNAIVRPGKCVKNPENGSLMADPRRRTYQKMKREYYALKSQGVSK